MKNYVTITLQDHLQSDQENPVMIVVKDVLVEVVNGLIHIGLLDTTSDKDEIESFLYRQFELQKRMDALIDSSNEPVLSPSYSFQVHTGEADEVGYAELILDVATFDVEMSDEVEIGEVVC